MNKAYIFSVGIVILLFGGGIAFVMRSHTTKDFSVSNALSPANTSLATEPVSFTDATEKSTISEQAQEVVPEKTQPETNTPSESANTNTGTDKGVDPKSNTKDIPVKGAPKEIVTKTSSVPSALNIHSKLVSFGFTVPSKPRTIDTIIVHSSYDAVGSDPYSVAGIMAEWKDAGVAPHYMIARDGQVYQLVKDENIAYHAGVSKVSDGRTDVNSFSLGIEIFNTKTDSYTDAQYTSVKQLIAFLKGKYTIKYVLGHNDIAPGRKSDPWNFDWKKL
jgi:hypothetical protein